MRIDSAVALGIGTTSPWAPLSIYKDTDQLSGHDNMQSNNSKPLEDSALLSLSVGNGSGDSLAHHWGLTMGVTYEGDSYIQTNHYTHTDGFRSFIITTKR